MVDYDGTLAKKTRYREELFNQKLAPFKRHIVASLSEKNKLFFIDFKDL